MSSTSAADRQKLLLQQEIAKLSGAISRHASQPTHHPSYHPYARGRGGPSTRSRGRGRGRGRGGYSLNLRNAAAPASSVPASSAKEAGEVSPPATPVPAPASGPSDTANWVKTSETGNMSLMTAETKAKLQSRPKPARKPKIPPQIQVLSSSSTSEGQRVVIDGVIFQFEQDGKKLTRIGELQNPEAQTTPTRRKLNYDGNKYRRTSRGNLVQAKSTIPCRFYTKTGRCNKALTCPYAHIPDRLAICQPFLRSSCPNTPETCPLSHKPSAHNTPSCVRFQAASSCWKGSDCLFPHVQVEPNAPICVAFARGGWCDKEPGTCPDLHSWECPEYKEKGTCSKGGKCGLRHVLRAEREKEVEARSNLPVGSFEENTDFINLDQGSPLDISDEDMSPDEEGEDEDDDDDEDNDDGDRSSASGESDDSDEEADEVLGVVA